MHKVWGVLALFNVPTLLFPVYFQCDVYLVCLCMFGGAGWVGEGGWFREPELDNKKGFILFSKEYICSLLYICTPIIHLCLSVSASLSYLFIHLSNFCVRILSILVSFPSYSFMWGTLILI